VYQPGVDFAIDKLNRQGWIHIYPESKVVQSSTMIRFKWGIGRILMDADEPIVVPVWHTGMRLAKPLYGTKLLHPGKPITLVFGDPIDYSDLLRDWKSGKLTEEETRIQITTRMYDAVDKLRKEYQ
jgi:monolysocardiolipin acyltransferase